MSRIVKFRMCMKECVIILDLKSIDPISTIIRKSDDERVIRR